MCRLVGSTEPPRQSIFPLRDSSSLVKPTPGSQLQAFPARLLRTSPFQSTPQTFLHRRTHCRHLSIAGRLLFVHALPQNIHYHVAEKWCWSWFKYMDVYPMLFSRGSRSNLQPALLLQSQKGPQQLRRGKPLPQGC